MNEEEANKLIYDEAKRSFDISIDSIRAYDGRVHQIIVLTTSSLGILFVIAGFLGLDFFNMITSKFGNFPNIPPLEVGCMFAFFSSIVCFFIALIFCMKAYTSSKFRVLNPEYVKNGYESLSNKNDFLDELIYQIGDEFKENSDILDDLYKHYTNSIISVSIGWTLLAIFTIISIILVALNGSGING